MAGKEAVVSPKDLPMTFQVKYMGYTPARGLWGIKHTRKPVDTLVNDAKNLPSGKYIPRVKVVVSKQGIAMVSLKTQIVTNDKSRRSDFDGEESKSDKKKNFEVPTETDDATKKIFPIASISYGVQDLVYTRVFSMIIVKETDNVLDNDPFECHAFVCDSRAEARRLTYALAAAFHDYSAKVNELEKKEGKTVRKKFAIDLRTPEELVDAEQEETDA